MSPDLKPSGYAIDYQQETVALGADGRAQEGYKVGFHTRLGNSGSVFVPRVRYTPDNVAAEVAAHAAILDAVQKLSG